MTRVAYLLGMFALALALVSAFFEILPASPFLQMIEEFETFLQSESVHTGLAWFAWFFPVNNVLVWIPATVNAVVAFYGARLTLMVLKLHV